MMQTQETEPQCKKKQSMLLIFSSQLKYALKVSHANINRQNLKPLPARADQTAISAIVKH